MGRRASIVLVAPNPVPNTRDEASSYEDDRRVVDHFDGGGDGRRHTKERYSQKRPSCRKVSMILSNV